MIVLHVFTPHRLDDKLIQQVQRQCAVSNDKQSTHIFCSFHAFDIPIPGRHITLQSFFLRQQWVEMLYQYMPSYVHLHGEANATLSRIAKWTTQRNFKILHTNHSPKVILKKNITYLRTRLLADTVYQYTINKYKNKKHIRTPLSDNTIHAILYTLKNYYDPHADGQPEDNLLFSQSSNDKKIILNFARAQQVEKPIAATMAELFPQHDAENITPMSLKTSNGMLLDKLKELHTCIRQETVTLRQLIDTYSALRYYNDDEQQLLQQAKSLKQLQFLQHIETVMKDMFNLTEGYMPAPPLNNRQTDIIRKHIYNAMFKN